MAPGRAQAQRQQVSVPVFVLGLHLISEMHKTDLELVLELQSLENAVNLSLGLVGKRKKKLSKLNVS